MTSHIVTYLQERWKRKPMCAATEKLIERLEKEGFWLIGKLIGKSLTPSRRFGRLSVVNALLTDCSLPFYFALLVSYFGVFCWCLS